MQEYTYDDFLNTIDDTGRFIAKMIHDHIAIRYPEYKPFDIRPMNKTLKEWALNFRKKPKTGKALCSLYSNNDKLIVQVIPLGFMWHELLIRQNEFNGKIHRLTLPGICKNCKSHCYYQFRQHYYINNRFIATTKPKCESNEYSAENVDYYGYGAMNDITMDDIKDLLYLIDIQTKYMTKDPREIMGNDYAETSRKRCGDIEMISLEETKLSIDDFTQSYYANPKRLDKYAAVYHLTPMGANDDGLWYYHNDRAVCGEADGEYCHTAISEGNFASVTINDPFSFSAWRVWNYIAGWTRDNRVNIRPVKLNGVSVPFFTKFFRQSNGEYMTVYVPVN